MALSDASTIRRLKNMADYSKTGLSNIALNLFSYINDESYAKYVYRLLTGKVLDLDNPKTFDEKLWWLKLNDRNPLLTVCSDKVAVRDYVNRCGLNHILNQIYGVYENAGDIDFWAFTEEVFIKCNHGSGMNLLYDPAGCNDRMNVSTDHLNLQLSFNYYLLLREWNYKNILPKLICEKVLRNSDGTLPLDYKFFCFSGEPEYMLYDTNVCTKDGRHSKDARRNMYDMGFNLLNVQMTRKNFNPDLAEKPQGFEEMKRYAKILAQPFPFCRVDFYNVEGRIYLGEMSFYHMGACNKIHPYEWDLKLGAQIDLSHPGIRVNETSLINNRF